MVQGGDPTGTGNGGESIYGSPFIDEFHSRLKFNHRGLLAMANANKPDTNHSQFFFTLDSCEFLERKHTIFGKVSAEAAGRVLRGMLTWLVLVLYPQITGNTIFNLLSVGDLETDAQDRPTNPPKLLSTEVLWNPFDDIVPREIKRKEPIDEAAALKRKKKERKATKDLKLLSFGEEEEEFNQALASHAKKKPKKMMSSHDLLDDRKLKADVDHEVAQKIAEHSSSSLNKSVAAGMQDSAVKKENARLSLKASVAAALKKSSALTEPTVEATDASATEQAMTGIADKEEEDVPKSAESKKDKKRKKAEAVDEYTQLREELRRSRKAAPVLLGSKAKDQEDAKAQDDMLTPLQQQRQKYLARKKALNRSGRQQETLQKLQKFQATLADANKLKPSEREDKKGSEAYHGQVLQSDASDSDREDAGGSKSQPDLSWMAAKLKFKKHIDVRRGTSRSLKLGFVR